MRVIMQWNKQRVLLVPVEVELHAPSQLVTKDHGHLKVDLDFGRQNPSEVSLHGEVMDQLFRG